ncbi:MAG: 2-succinyl-5-enolpyruvyl-6-hydroxy-3-cyclohexene-1-carboxylic-acid synthase [Chlorobiales bacterium]|nr:2-succinyl-5-enolpyruvyl-6-hydroxy-3-cyclohexene-1-carboxylic-acid synthase [Chlorobiales bacterium]
MPNINSFWASLIVEELIRNGVDYFCISPGSRSTPLTVAVARNPKAQSQICIDERGAAFHALGYARATGKPAALICTSGTAVANYFPAVVEASMSYVPMLILSADRPPELRETGANQTIRQPNIFGGYTRWQFDLPCPDEAVSPHMVLTTVDHAFAHAVGSPSGPVHLNCMFRDPLVPVEVPVGKACRESISAWRQTDAPYTKTPASLRCISENSLTAVAEIFRLAERPMIVVGGLITVDDASAIDRLSQALNVPLFADIASGLRLGNSSENHLAYYDQLLLSERFRYDCVPDAVLHFGGQITSKRLNTALEQWMPAHYMVVKNHPFRYDPSHRATHSIGSNIPAFCEALIPLVEKSGRTTRSELCLKNRVVAQVIEAELESETLVSEISLARLVSKLIPNDWGLFISNSMPIRDMDMYAAVDAVRVPVGVNRGASGIDGIIASASGFAVGLNRPVTLVIGDISFLHDLNSLILARAARQTIVIVVINNGGGGIFSFLPISEHTDVFEQYFETPQSFSIEEAAKMFGLDYYAPQTNKDFTLAYQMALGKRQVAIIEVRTNRRENFKAHKDLQARILAALEKAQ